MSERVGTTAYALSFVIASKWDLNVRCGIEYGRNLKELTWWAVWGILRWGDYLLPSPVRVKRSGQYPVGMTWGELRMTPDCEWAYFVYHPEDRFRDAVVKTSRTEVAGFHRTC